VSTASPMRHDEVASRREEIRRLLRTQRVATQEDLRRQLHKLGHDVTQATLSRDLAWLGARRAVMAGGGTAYELPELPVAVAVDPLAELADLVRDVDHNGTLVVMHTSPGAASAVALAIDRARLPEVLGTLAGDDTIFLAPSRGTPSRNAARKLVQVFGKAAPK
jgi:transcriptional regulator of arginine metabolism